MRGRGGEGERGWDVRGRVLSAQTMGGGGGGDESQ